MKIGIAGCGPAGLATALLLDEQGHDVTLLERFDTPSPVGSGIILQPTGLAVLRQLGLANAIYALGKRIDTMHGTAMPTGKTVLDVNYQSLGAGFHGLAVHRAALFNVLYDKVCERQIEVVTDFDIVDVRHARESIAAVDARDESQSTFELLVDASGAGTNLHAHAFVQPRKRELRYGAIWGSCNWPQAGFDENVLAQRYVGAHTMVGVLPIGRHGDCVQDQVALFWSLKTAAYPQWQENGLEHWKTCVQSVWPETETILCQIKEPSEMTLARYGHSTLRVPYGDKIVFVGDAAHSTSPQLGQGANMALLDAWALAQALPRYTAGRRSLERYASSRRWHVRAFQWSSLAMTPFYQSDSRLLAGLRDLLFDPVAKLPVARRIVAGLISGLLAGPPAGLDYTP